MFKKAGELTQDVIKAVGLVSGTGVQTYTEPQILNAINMAFELIFRKRYWDHLSDWVEAELDGVNGYLTTDLKNIVKSYEDAKEFHIAESGQRIVKPINNEHLLRTASTMPLWYRPVKWGDPNFATRVFQFFPKTATGTVRFFARTHPGSFNSNQEVPLPWDIMAYAAAWKLLETDGMNPSNAALMQNMFQVTYSDYISSISDDVIGHAGGHRNAHTVWTSSS